MLGGLRRKMHQTMPLTPSRFLEVHTNPGAAVEMVWANGTGTLTKLSAGRRD